MGDGSQFPALTLDNNPWMRYFSPASGAEVADLTLKTRAPGAPIIVVQPPTAAPQPSVPPVMRSQSGKLTRHTSAPNRLNAPPPAAAAPPPAPLPSTSDRGSGSGDSRRGKAEAPAGDPAPAPSSAPRLQKKPSNPLLQKQKMFASKSMNTQSAPNLTASMRELALSDGAGRSIESELSQQSLYKTELCRSFEETGACRYGSKCQFAHGKAELRPVIRHPKYKTEVCKTWQAHGSCPYGARCRFIHGDEPHAAPPPPPAAAGIVAPTPLPASSAVPIADPLRTPVSPSSSSSPGPRLAIFADIIGESSAQ